MRLLIVEDEKKLAAFLKKGLVQEGFVADVCASGEAAVNEIMSGVYDLVLLDVHLPDRDGFSVLKQCRKEGSTVPVLMLTARDTIDDKVKGLETGANDYLTKPFSFRELVARVRVLLRPSSDTPHLLVVGDLSLDLLKRSATRGQQKITLTNKEFALLEILMRNAGRPVSRTRLWEQAWDGSFEVDSNVLDVHVARLRKKIDDHFKTPLLQTVHGVGYRLESPGKK